MNNSIERERIGAERDESDMGANTDVLCWWVVDTAPADGVKARAGNPALA